jgi:hypothetical protein
MRTTLELQARYWPPVNSYSGLPDEHAAWLELDPAEQRSALRQLRADPAEHSRLLHQLLATIYGYVLGYRDSPCHLRADDALEIKLLTAKVMLERELLEHWLDPAPTPSATDQRQARAELQRLIVSNRGLDHPLFGYLATQATREAVVAFLRTEVIRNEVVDDEVALLLVGLQGKQKAMTASNLWDECGRGKLANFHTYWLRQLLDQLEDWHGLAEFRTSAPWSSKITSNVLNMLLTRPGYTMMAYGCFLVFESWVMPHFKKILHGLDRVGLGHADIRLYFASHVAIDPRHAQELLDGLADQEPALTSQEVEQIMRGARIAVAAGVAQYDRMLAYLRTF